MLFRRPWIPSGEENPKAAFSCKRFDRCAKAEIIALAQRSWYLIGVINYGVRDSNVGRLKRASTALMLLRPLESCTRGEPVAQQPKFTHDLEKERKKLQVLWLVLLAVLAILLVVLIVSVLR